ncbi:MAG TPA: YjgN family protein, partial [Methylotenera sp.]|nr:YjgN family protein [Methylotenera sp.]
MLPDKIIAPVDFEFQGKASEYFRIWIVNILLTILTLGIYSAWAKVRNKQYFYANTLLQGSSFKYNASPLAILKGRLVLVLILAFYFISIHFYPATKILFILLFILALPGLIMLGLMFNARYSFYRHLNFAFEKSLGESVKTFIGIALLIPLTLGLIYPYYMHAIQSYRVNHHRFGQLNFSLQSVVKAFYKYYAIAGILFITGLAVVAIVFQGSALGSMQETLTADSEQLPEHPPLAIHALLQMVACYGVIYLLVFAYLQARIFNLVWSNTRLDRIPANSMLAKRITVVTFQANLGAWKLFWIYLTNMLAIIASIGLLIPWAKIRLTRYRIHHMNVAAIGDLHAIS